MSTPVGSSQWMYTPASGFYPYLIDQSLRFNDNDSAYLNRTPASTGDRKTWTLSMWVKRANLGINTTLFAAGSGSTNQTKIRFVDSDGSILFDNEVGGSTTVRYYTSNLFRDVSSWYHFVFEVDTTQAADADKVKIYVNGEQVTSFSATPNYPSLNEDLFVNNTNVHYIGRELGGGYLDAYLAEVNFIDGTALDATSFGETINGVWVPKAYDTADGAYGTNGFYLSFADSSAIGDDLSGNTNDWTANNLAASDVMSGESPTNNFATLNSVHPNASTGNFSEGNLRSYQDQSPYTDFYATFAVSSGKWYWEARAAGTAVQQIWGFAREDALTTANGGAASGTTGYAYLRYGSVARERANGSDVNSSSTLSVAAGDIIALALNLDDNEIKFYKNGTLEHTITGVQDGTYYPFVCYQMNLNRLEQRVNFGQDSTFAGLETAGGNSDDNGVGDFAQSVISGHLAICSANLPEATIGPNSDEQADDYFNTVLYTGTGASNSITGVNFQSDFTWIKSRSSAYNNVLWDTVRGATKQLSSNTSGAESTQAQGLTSFDSDGFTLGTNSNLNNSGTTYVGWNWKAGGTAVSNTDGSITSSVSANQDAGFSIVSYTGNLTAGATVGHGLSETPEIIFVKNRDSAQNWNVWHKDLTSEKVLYLNLGAAENNSPASFGTHTNQVFGVDNSVESNGSGNAMIAYCFHSVPGYSAVGSYRGNANADGTFVHLGFRPRWLLLKDAESTNLEWNIYYDEASPFNVMNDYIAAASSAAEATNISTRNLDFVSNGFKLRDQYASNYVARYIYLAFAEAPFKYANAR